MKLWDKKCYIVILIVVTIGIINMTYYQFFLKRICSKNPAKCDFMNRIAFRATEGCCSYWPISHFIMHLILGFLFPECWFLLLIIGIGWEGMEFIFGLFERSKGKDSSLQYSEKWWAPNIADLILNIAGLVVGLGLNKLWKAYKTNKNV